ncbi:MAG TPA: C4-dicarboxylate ABC transporter, partial [Rhizobiaceae bacterium]|nr:C4-dicarboxylate ABC transporter [Rhizobiaceae bacterium]
QTLAYLLVTSTEWLNGLDAEVRDQFLTIVNDVTKKANDEVAAKENECRENIVKAGGTIRELTPEQRAEWVNAMKPVWGKFEGDIGKDLIDAAVSVNGS